MDAVGRRPVVSLHDSAFVEKPLNAEVLHVPACPVSSLGLFQRGIPPITEFERAGEHRVNLFKLITVLPVNGTDIIDRVWEVLCMSLVGELLDPSVQGFINGIMLTNKSMPKSNGQARLELWLSTYVQTHVVQLAADTRALVYEATGVSLTWDGKDLQAHSSKRIQLHTAQAVTSDRTAPPVAPKPSKPPKQLRVKKKNGKQQQQQQPPTPSGGSAPGSASTSGSTSSRSGKSSHKRGAQKSGS